MDRAVEEAREIEAYDYMIINDDLDESVEEVHRLIDGQHNKISRNLDFIEQIRKEITEFAKGE
jgi:guanylate kinase